jgi:hypothetical protein
MFLPQGFISGPGHDGLAVGRHCQIQHAVGMARQLGHLDERGVFPHQDLVLRVAVGRDELGGVLGPREIAHLAAGVDRLHGLTGQGVPEPDTAVGRST